ARAKVQQNLDQGVEKGKVKPEEREGALARLSTTSDFADAIRGAAAGIEAVPERIALKQELFQKLGAALPRDVLLATNTSSLPVSQIASAARHPERVTGMHFFNPVRIKKLVEVVRGEHSSPEAVSASADLARRMGKDPITVKDSPG